LNSVRGYLKTKLYRKNLTTSELLTAKRTTNIIL